jgi:uncharacterized protein
MRKIAHTNVIIAHGAYGFPEENWFGWLKRKLESIGVNCYVPPLPTPDAQHLTNWKAAFNQAVNGCINQNTILVGHSLGAAFLYRWLEQFDGKILSLISVGAFIGEVGIAKFDDLNRSFFDAPFEWEIIKSKLFAFNSDHNNSYCYYGTGDPYVSRTMFDLISGHLKARKIIVANAGHFNSSSGYSEFPLLFSHIMRICERPRLAT